MRRLAATSMGSAAAMPLAVAMLRRRQPVTTQRVPARRRPRSLPERCLVMAGLMLGIGGTLGALGYWSVTSGWAGYAAAVAGEGFIDASAHAGYALRTLEIDGRRETPKQDVMLALGALKGDAILDIDLEAARQRIVDLPWVTAAVVERRLPDTLRVILTEADPLALWQENGIFHLVSRTGDVLTVTDVARFGKLPVIVGKAAPQRAGELFAMLATEPRMQARITHATLVGNRRWNLRTDNGVDIKLPEVNPAAAWMRLASLERQQHLLDRDVSIIDLRQADKLVVRIAHPALSGETTGADGAGKAITGKDTPAQQPVPEEKPVLTPAATPLSAPAGSSNDT